MSSIKDNSTQNSKSSSQPWYKSGWVIFWLFLIVTVLSVNAYMVYQSMNDFPGLVVDDFYKRGQNYEEKIHTKLKNNQKWISEFTINEVHVNKPAKISITIKDHSGQHVAIEKLTLFAYRPSDAKKDFFAALSTAESQEGYQTSMTFNSKGKWDLIASAIIDGIEVNYAKSIFVLD